jgi:hypothetical protein
MLQTTATFRNTRERRIVRPSRHSDTKETDVLKKTCVTGGLIIATAAGTLLTGSAATAEPMGGCFHGCWSSHFRFRSFSHNFNGNRNFAHNRIRIRINNRNNNVAVARNAQRQRQREREFQFPRLRGIGPIGDLG